MLHGERVVSDVHIQKVWHAITSAHLLPSHRPPPPTTSFPFILHQNRTIKVPFRCSGSHGNEPHEVQPKDGTATVHVLGKLSKVELQSTREALQYAPPSLARCPAHEGTPLAC